MTKLANYLRLALAGMLVSACIVGCQQKQSRSVTFEGPDNRYELELESTDKDPGDDE